MVVKTTTPTVRAPNLPPTIRTHTMGASLYRYLEMKMHQKVRNRCYDRITIVGAYTRTEPANIFEGEKRDKDFNWQRPTARVIGNELQIECFPGYDHVEHYAELVATYLDLQRSAGNKALTPFSSVGFVPVSCSDTQMALWSTNLSEVPRVDTVVLGLVHRLERLTGSAKWEGGDGCFGWTVREFGGRSVAFIGCRPSFWGDISGEIVHFLAATLSVRQFVYFGKLGSVKPSVRPNAHLATGTGSYVNGRLVKWPNILERSARLMASDILLIGDHVTLGSVLHETKEWLEVLPKSVQFVDPEIGTIAQAAIRSGVGFGYLHIISDNVSEKYSEDLSNERETTILRGRLYLYDMVQDVLLHHLSRYVSV